MLVTICRFSFEYPSMPDLLHLVNGRFSRNCGPPFGNPAHKEFSNSLKGQSCTDSLMFLKDMIIHDRLSQNP